MENNNDGNSVMKFDFKNMLNMSDDDDDETTDEVDEITNDENEKTVKLRRGGKKLITSEHKRTVDSSGNMVAAAAASGTEGSFERERAELTETFENEKSDIVKGFILEKRILSTEHTKEKKDLISNFVAERQRMLESFQRQVKDIEQKMSSTATAAGNSSKPMSSSTVNKESISHQHQQNSSRLPEKVFDLSVDGKQRSEMNGKLLIKVEGDRILTPEQFLSAMELEERFESEKEIIEKSFRKEKHQLKDKLEVEFSRKLLREKERHERDMATLHLEIDKLRNSKNDISGMCKSQESNFFKEQRSAMERHYSEENEKLRRRLEERNESKLSAQQQEYDRMIRDLRGELRQIKKEITKSGGCSETPKPGSGELRREIELQLRGNYENEMRLVRQQNEKLNNEIQKLTTDKYDLARKLREIEFDKTNESKYLQQHTEKVGKEYADKMKKAMSHNEKLKLQISQLEKQKEELKILTKNQQNNAKGVEGRLELTERTIIQYEDTVTGLRRENSNLSHEIHLLRIEKEELSSIISQYNEQERSIKVDAQRLQHDLEDWRKKGVLMEREKLKAEKAYDLAMKEIDRSKAELKKAAARIDAHVKETDRLRNLLEGERSENKRLHERFKTDANLLRKKEGENTTTRTQLDNLKMQFETLKTKIEADNERIFKLEKERQSLQKQLDTRKNTTALQDKQQLAKVQSSYCKEFTKRMEYVKACYEREIFNLKERIGELQNSQEQEKHRQQQQQQQHNVSTKNPRVPSKQHCQSCKSSAVEPDNNSQPERRVYINSCSNVNLDVPAAVQFMNQKNARNDQDNDVRCFPPNEKKIRDLLLTTKQNKVTQQNQVNNCFFVVQTNKVQCTIKCL